MILVCGEALVDLFLEPAQGAAIPARVIAGGSPFNVAVGLGRLGARAAFLGGLSSDHFGQHLAALLDTEGVSLDFARHLPQLTTISVVALGPGGTPRYAFHGEGAADRMFGVADLPGELPPGIAAITFGSYSLAVEPCGSAYLALAQREKDRRVISLDPNVRPTIIGDMARWHNRFATFAACASVIKASEEDIALAYGETAAIGEIARMWLGFGPRLVVITRGADGAVAFAGSDSLALPGHAVDVVDTVGAGDTFHAALLARLDQRGWLDRNAIGALRPDAIADVLDYAIAASALACTRRGADLPRRSDVDGYLSRAGRP